MLNCVRTTYFQVSRLLITKPLQALNSHKHHPDLISSFSILRCKLCVNVIHPSLIIEAKLDSEWTILNLANFQNNKTHFLKLILPKNVCIAAFSFVSLTNLLRTGPPEAVMISAVGNFGATKSSWKISLPWKYLCLKNIFALKVSLP